MVLSKDVVRAALFPGTLTDYTREQDDLCFRMVLEAAEYLAGHNQTEFIFLDGRTFSRGEQIEQAIRAAERCGLRDGESFTRPAPTLSPKRGWPETLPGIQRQTAPWSYIERSRPVLSPLPIRTPGSILPNLLTSA